MADTDPDQELAVHGFMHPSAPDWAQSLAEEHGRQMGVLRRHLDTRLNDIRRELLEIMSDIQSAQADINTEATAIQGLGGQVATVQSAVTDLSNEVTALKQNNPTVDTSSLDSAVSGLQSALGTLATQAQSADPGPQPVPTPPVPPAPPAPPAPTP